MPNKTKLQRGCLRWGLGLLIGCMVLILANCAGLQEAMKNAEPYTKTEKVLVGTTIVFGITDGVLTARGVEQGAIERHPLLGKNPSVESIALYTVTSLAITIGFSHLYKNARAWLLGGYTAVRAGASWNNWKTLERMESRK